MLVTTSLPVAGSACGFLSLDLFTFLLPLCLSRWFFLQNPRSLQGGQSLFLPLPRSSLPKKLQRQSLLMLLRLMSLALHLSSHSHLSLPMCRPLQLLVQSLPLPLAWLPSLSSSGKLLMMIIMSFLLWAPLLLKILGIPALPRPGPLAPRHLFLLAVRLKMMLSSHRCRQASLFWFVLLAVFPSSVSAPKLIAQWIKHSGKSWY